MCISFISILMEVTLRVNEEFQRSYMGQGNFPETSKTLEFVHTLDHQEHKSYKEKDYLKGKANMYKKSLRKC
jgi:hypothetical protein